ncbi:MAG TPA: UDP-glucuronic acid decarboxylase family protein [Myxococcaceae bacterium]|nr:UDP-glucuronic acid decarboxylase family protein [Myxococcaceae bacterium]
MREASARFAGQRAVVFGGAGFLGSHLCEALLNEGAQVVSVDNFLTGRPENHHHLLARPGFRFLEADLSEGVALEGRVDAVFNLASPASPIDYAQLPLETLKVGSQGTWNALELALRHRARFLQASTSEVYGDPLEHPQQEAYWGNVNPVGPRACYDEAKRFGEALCTSFSRVHGLPVRIARIFNTYGPRMRLDDGRVVPAFLSQAAAGRPLTVFGDGSQTRAFCYVDDLIEGLLRLSLSDAEGPVNLGHPGEIPLLTLAEAVGAVVGRPPTLRHLPLPEDDPRRRRPDITRARELLGWEPTVPLDEGLRAVWAWMQTLEGDPAAP